MIIDTVFQMLKRLASKSQSGGYLSPTDYNYYAKLAQYQKLDYEAKKEIDSSFKSDSLSSFKVNGDLPVVSGILTLPADYRYFMSAYYNDYSTGVLKPSEINELTDSEWGFRLGSELDNPSKPFPVMVVRDGEIEIAPSDITVVDFTYIKTPVDPIWAYTTASNRREFDAGTSVDFTFGEEDVADLVYRMAVMLGIDIRDGELLQVSMAEQAKEQ